MAAFSATGPNGHLVSLRASSTASVLAPILHAEPDGRSGTFQSTACACVGARHRITGIEHVEAREELVHALANRGALLLPATGDAVSTHGLRSIAEAR